jgi:hypothetical protein
MHSLSDALNDGSDDDTDVEELRETIPATSSRVVNCDVAGWGGGDFSNTYPNREAAASTSASE